MEALGTEELGTEALGADELGTEALGAGVLEIDKLGGAGPVCRHSLLPTPRKHSASKKGLSLTISATLRP